MSQRTFRLQGIPQGWTKDTVASLVRNCFQLGNEAVVSVRSLAQSVFRRGEDVATLEIHPTPPELADPKVNEWFHTLESDPPLEVTFDTHFWRLTPLFAPDDFLERTSDIIAISGLGGHAFGSFKRKGGNFMWLRDTLPQDLPHARIFIYGYDTAVENSASAQNIHDLGEGLRTALRLTRTQSKSHDLVLIGHSLGGILVKEAIVQMKCGSDENKSNLENIRGLLLFGVPNRGMAIGSLVSMVGNNPNRFLLEVLSTTSHVMQEYTARFLNTFTSKKAMVYSFYETKLSRTAQQDISGEYKMIGPLEMLVQQDSAKCGRDWENEGEFVHALDRNHSELVKFRSPHDHDYMKVLRCLQAIFAFTEGKDEKDTSEDEIVIQDAKADYILRSLEFPEMNYRYDTVQQAHHNTFDWLFPKRQGYCVDFLGGGYHDSHDHEGEGELPGAARRIDSTGHFDYDVRDYGNRDDNRLKARRAFSVWAQQDDCNQSIFWITGKPGSGKSTLMKYIYQQPGLRMLLRKWTDGCNPILAGHFLFDRGSSPLQKSRDGLLRTLLHQILSQKREIIPKVSEWFIEEPRGETVEAKASHLRMLQQIKFTWQELQTMFETTLEAVTETDHLCLFVDGLDEYRKNHDVRRYATYLSGVPEGYEDLAIIPEGYKELVDMFLRLARHRKLKICLASRSLLAFEDGFQGFPHLRLHELTLNDIWQFVSDNVKQNKRLRTIPRFSLSSETLLINTITDLALGVFLWVDLVVGRILAGLDTRRFADFQAIFTMINSLPIELGGPEGLFMRILRDIPLTDRVNAVLSLKMVMAAKEEQIPLTPMTLHFSQKSPEDAINSNVEAYSEEDVQKANVLGTDFIKDQCRGLLEVRRGQVVFLHQTVQDFVRESLEWEEVKSWSHSDLDPYVPLLISCLLIIKRIQNSICWNIGTVVMKALQCARLAEITTGMAQTALLGDLDQAMRSLWATRVMRQHPNDPHTCTTIERPDWALWVQWLTEGGECALSPSWPRTSILQLAIYRGVHLYASEMLRSSHTWRGQGESALDYILLISPFIPCSKLIKRLLQNGEQPNYRKSCGCTVWQSFLQKNCFFYATDEIRKAWVDIVISFLEAGADVTSWEFSRTEGCHFKSPAAVIIERARSLDFELHPLLHALSGCGAFLTRDEKYHLQRLITVADYKRRIQYMEELRQPPTVVFWHEHAPNSNYIVRQSEQGLDERVRHFPEFTKFWFSFAGGNDAQPFVDNELFNMWCFTDPMYNSFPFRYPNVPTGPVKDKAMLTKGVETSSSLYITAG